MVRKRAQSDTYLSLGYQFVNCLSTKKGYEGPFLADRQKEEKENCEVC